MALKIKLAGICCETEESVFSVFNEAGELPLVFLFFEEV
jgi:hypothetical protein